MREEDWKRMEEHFHRLASLGVAERSDRLTELSVTDPALADELRTLLAAHDAEGVVDRLGARLAPAPPVASPPLTGASVSHYTVGELIGRGGMGDVYRGRDRRLDRDVALKFLPPWMNRDPAARDRFHVEARIVSSIDHPNVCTLLDVGETEDARLYLVMPFYDGESLKRRLERGPLPVGEAVDVALQAARGLAAAHERGIVHRDIKPANLLLAADGRVRLLDFGVAKLTDVSLTRPGQRPGTENYMAPEQAEGDVVDARADLWALGAVLFEMVTGRRPGADPERRAAAVAGLPPVLAEIAGRLLAPDPDDRYPDARSAAADLELVASAPDALAPRPASDLERLFAEFKRRHVFRVAAVYGAIAFGLIEAADVMFPRVGLPEWTVTLVVWLLVLGFPVALVLAWALEMTPDGLRRTRPVRTAMLDAIVAQPARRRWPAGFAGLLGGLLLATGAWLALGPSGGPGWPWRASAEPTAPASPAGATAPGVAVLPFRVVGEDLAYLREGVVDLMSYHFDLAPGLRKIDASAVMGSWDERIGAGRDAPDAAAAVEVARALGARYGVHGSAVRTGPSTVRLAAEVFDAGSGEARGAAQVEGSVDSLASLIDGLTVELLRRGLVPADGGYASANLARVTTSSVPALTAYLAGESAYRRGRYVEAAGHFRDAVERDSAFARAYYRLGWSVNWSAGDGSEHFRKAAELASGLPERDSLLMLATVLPPPEALRVLERLTSRYPDDPDAWFMLGDGLFHSGGVLLRPASDYVEPLRRAAALAPHYEETTLHLFEDAFFRFDRDRVDELIALTGADDPGTGVCRGFALLRDMRWADDETVSMHAAQVFDSLYVELDNCMWTAVAAVEPARRIAERHELPYVAPDVSGGVAIQFLWRMIQARATAGQLEAARGIVARASANEALATATAQYAVALDAPPYTTDPARARSSLATLAATPRSARFPYLHDFWTAAMAVVLDRPEEFAPAVARIDSIAAAAEDPETADQISAYARGLEAYRALAAGDLGQIAALERAQAVLHPYGWLTDMPSSFLRFEAGRLLLEADRPGDAERYLRSLYPYSWHYVPAQYHLGRLYEAGGKPALARERYRIFTEAWATADAELQPLVREARAALSRLD